VMQSVGSLVMDAVAQLSTKSVFASVSKCVKRAAIADVEVAVSMVVKAMHWSCVKYGECLRGL
jgi:hypothetical protein